MSDLGRSARKAVAVTFSVVGTLVACAVVAILVFSGHSQTPTRSFNQDIGRTLQVTGNTGTSSTSSPCAVSGWVVVSGQCSPPPMTAPTPNFVGQTVEYAESHPLFVHGIAWAISVPDGDICTNGGAVAKIVSQSPKAGTPETGPDNLPTIILSDSCPS